MDHFTHGSDDASKNERDLPIWFSNMLATFLVCASSKSDSIPCSKLHHLLLIIGIRIYIEICAEYAQAGINTCL